jgi:AraC-like DNA-binding protein
VFCSLSLQGEGLLLQTTRLLSIWETILVFIIGYKGLIQPEIFSSDDVVVPAEKYKQSNLSRQESEEYRTKLMELMEKEKPFLQENLTIKELSEQLSISPRHLSQVLNERLGQNFYDFINRYRVEEAKKRLIEYGDQKKSILSIGYDVGFNSKSTFNTVFKKYTKMTPTQYREKHIT